jgi:hypothetical protein
MKRRSSLRVKKEEKEIEGRKENRSEKTRIQESISRERSFQCRTS